MRVLKTLFTFVVILVIVFVVGGYLIPQEWVVTRSAVIKASPETVYPLIGDFKAWPKWVPWNASKDSTLQYTYEGPEMGVGAKQNWTSEKMGKGWMQFTQASPESGVSYDLFIDMGRSQSTLQGTIAFEKQGDSTNITWTDKGNSGNNFFKRWMSLVLKPMLGKDLEQALANLKAIAEKK